MKFRRRVMEDCLGPVFTGITGRPDGVVCTIRDGKIIPGIWRDAVCASRRKASVSRHANPKLMMVSMNSYGDVAAKGADIWPGGIYLGR